MADSLSPHLRGAVKRAFERLKPELLAGGAYYEFGVYQGATFCEAERHSRHLRGPGFMFYGFDSFKGLPKPGADKQSNWYEGAYLASLDEVEENIRKNDGADREKFVLTSGFFSQDLFRAFWEKHSRTPAIVVVDSDLYESCREVLAFFGPKLVSGSIILFDEFDIRPSGEQRAWMEFKEKHPKFRAEYLFSYPTDGSVFEVVAASGDH